MSQVIYKDIFENIIIPKLSALELDTLRRTSKAYGQALKTNFLKSLNSLSLQEFNALEFPESYADAVRIKYLKIQLQRRAKTPLSYKWFLEEAISLRDKWLLVPYFQIKDRYYFPDELGYIGILIWPPSEFYRFGGNKYERYFGKSDEITKYLPTPNSFSPKNNIIVTESKLKKKGYVRIDSEENYYYIPKDSQYYFLEPITVPEETIDLIKITRFPFIDDSVDPEAPSKQQITNLNSVVFSTALFISGFYLVSFNSILPIDSDTLHEFDDSPGVMDDLKDLIVFLKDTSQYENRIENHIVVISTFNLFHAYKPELSQKFLEMLEREGFSGIVTSDIERNKELLLNLIKKVTQ